MKNTQEYQEYGAQRKEVSWQRERKEETERRGERKRSSNARE